MSDNPFTAGPVISGGAAGSSQNIIDVSVDNLQPLIELSFERLVMFDFWAPWCEPCKTLTPLLEKLAAEYSDSLVLAKVDCEKEQMLATQFGVRNVPTIALFKDGQPVDGFSGAQPESVIRQLLEKYLPKPEDKLLQQGRALLDEGSYAEALQLLRQAAELDSQRADIRLALADAWLKSGRSQECRQLLDTILMQDQDHYYQSLKSELELKEQAAVTPEIQALEQARQQNPADLSLAHQLALQYHQAERHEESLALLLSVLEQDMAFEDGAARKSMLDILATLGQADPLAGQYRRKLYTLLY